MPDAPAISIRNVDDRDMAAIQDIYAHHVLHGLASWEETPPDEAEMTRRRDAIVVDRFPYLVAEAEGEILGYAYASKYRPRPAYRHTVENTVYVKDGAHRRGIGRKLLAELIDRCTDLGLRRMVAIIGDSDNSGSIGLHVNAGFAHVGIIPSCGFKNGQWLDQVIMQRSLGEGDVTDPDS
jgi:L-amino acid N-acyltransferase YncA